MPKVLTIGRLAELTGVPPKTIRYYEETGVLPPPMRSGSGYRLYSKIDVRRLELVRRARVLDMALPEICGLIRIAGTGTCDEFQDSFLQMVQGKREEVDRKIADLRHLKRDLKSLEAHLLAAGDEVGACHTMLECSPETCTCLGGRNSNEEGKKEAILWVDKLEPKS